jgi:hypothetical protein
MLIRKELLIGFPYGIQKSISLYFQGDGVTGHLND